MAIASLLSFPPLAILIAVQGLVSLIMAHAEIQVPDAHRKEPGVLWLVIGIPTGKIFCS